MNPDWRCTNAAFAWRNTSARRVGRSGYCDYAAALNPMRLNWLTRRAPGRAWTARARAGARPFATVRGPPGPQPALCGGVTGGFLPLSYRHCLFMCTRQQFRPRRRRHATVRPAIGNQPFGPCPSRPCVVACRVGFCRCHTDAVCCCAHSNKINQI